MLHGKELARHDKVALGERGDRLPQRRTCNTARVSRALAHAGTQAGVEPDSGLIKTTRPDEQPASSTPEALSLGPISVHPRRKPSRGPRNAWVRRATLAARTGGHALLPLVSENEPKMKPCAYSLMFLYL